MEGMQVRRLKWTFWRAGGFTGWGWALVILVMGFAFCLVIGGFSDLATRDPNYYTWIGERKLATQIYDLHQDVYRLQTQVAAQDGSR